MFCFKRLSLALNKTGRVEKLSLLEVVLIPILVEIAGYDLNIPLLFKKRRTGCCFRCGSSCHNRSRKYEYEKCYEGTIVEETIEPCSDLLDAYEDLQSL